MKYPTIEEVDNASREQLAIWFRYLPIGRNEQELEIVNRITERFNESGGWTPKLSKRVGWE